MTKKLDSETSTVTETRGRDNRPGGLSGEFNKNDINQSANQFIILKVLKTHLNRKKKIQNR